MSNAAATTTIQTRLKTNAFGVPSLLFFVFSAQAPMTGIVGAAALMIALGNGSGTPGAYVIVGAAIVLFAVGFTTITRCINTRGGFFAVVRAGLGNRIGTGCSLLALLCYNVIQFAMYGLLGATFSGLLASDLSLDVPWWVGALLAIALVWVLGSLNIDLGAKVLAVLVSAEFLLLLAFAFGILLTKGVGSVDFSASFAPTAVLAGAPGVAIMFAIAAMFGFESTAIYAPEAKNPEKTVPRATYVAVVVIAAFFTFTLLMLITYYGSGNAPEIAAASLSDDPTQFVLVPMTEILGPWSATVTQVLLCTSLLAGVLAFHNMVARYLHALGAEAILPRPLARTNRWHAPWVASLVQTALAVIAVSAFALNQLDPVTALFTWFSGLAVLALTVLYVITSVAVVVYFRRHTTPFRRWNTTVAPVMSIVAMSGIFASVANNFDQLIGSGGILMWSLVASVPVVALIGFALGGRGHDAEHVADVVDVVPAP